MVVGRLKLTAATALSIDLRENDEALCWHHGLSATIPYEIYLAWGFVHLNLHWLLGRFIPDAIDLYLAENVMSAVTFVGGVWAAAWIVPRSGPTLAVGVVAFDAGLATSRLKESTAFRWIVSPDEYVPSARRLIVSREASVSVSSGPWSLSSAEDLSSQEFLRISPAFEYLVTGTYG